MSDTIEPTEAEASVLAELFSTTRLQSNLAILRAYRDAEVAKATGELAEALEQISTRAHCISLSGPASTPDLASAWSKFDQLSVIAAIALATHQKAARAQQKDTP